MLSVHNHTWIRTITMGRLLVRKWQVIKRDSLRLGWWGETHVPNFALPGLHWLKRGKGIREIITIGQKKCKRIMFQCTFNMRGARDCTGQKESFFYEPVLNVVISGDAKSELQQWEAKAPELKTHSVVPSHSDHKVEVRRSRYLDLNKVWRKLYIPLKVDSDRLPRSKHLGTLSNSSRIFSIDSWQENVSELKIRQNVSWE